MYRCTAPSHTHRYAGLLINILDSEWVAVWLSVSIVVGNACLLAYFVYVLVQVRWWTLLLLLVLVLLLLVLRSTLAAMQAQAV